MDLVDNFLRVRSNKTPINLSLRMERIMETTFNPAADIAKSLNEFKLPEFGITSALDAQRKNIDAFTQANRQAYEGMLSMIRRQQEMFQQRTQELQATLQSASGFRQGAMFDQVAFVRQATTKLFDDMRELAEIVQRSQEEIWAAIGKPSSQG